METVVLGLEDPVEDLVRKDALFKKLNLREENFAGNAEAVIGLLVEHKALLQRPVILKGKRAIIGRPSKRVAEFLRE